MRKLRIKGLVKLADSARRELSQPLSAAGKEDRLREPVMTSLRQVDRIVAKHDVTVDHCIEGLRALRTAGIPLVLRIDPLFPRSPVTDRPLQTYADFGLPEPQTLDDLENLVALAKELNVRHVVYSPARITQPRGRKLSATMQATRSVYQAAAAPERLVFRGGSCRLPHGIARAHIVRPFLDLCDKYGVTVKYCNQEPIETP